jgi:hypothetical protein
VPKGGCGRWKIFTIYGGGSYKSKTLGGYWLLLALQTPYRCILVAYDDELVYFQINKKVK